MIPMYLYVIKLPFLLHQFLHCMLHLLRSSQFSGRQSAPYNTDTYLRGGKFTLPLWSWFWYTSSFFLYYYQPQMFLLIVMLLQAEYVDGR